MIRASRTVNFLPEIFKTPTNQKFLSATLDQLTQNPKFKRIQGFVGRANAPGFSFDDQYVPEISTDRQNYQLEPAAVFTDSKNQAVEAFTYPEFIDAIKLRGGNVDRHDRLFESEFYSWDPFVDFDKLVNFSQYYWLPAGPDSVNVSSTEIPFTNSFVVDREANGYEFSESTGTNPKITLVRGGTYTFNVTQPRVRFWIQSVPGITGTLPENTNISSRSVFGVENNGADLGTVTFNVPNKTAQSFFFDLTDIGSVDLVSDLRFDQINNIYVSEFLQTHGGIDGIVELDGKTVVITDSVASSGWQRTSFFDATSEGYDSVAYDSAIPIADNAEKTSVWQISYVEETAGEPYMVLSPVQAIPTLTKFKVSFGNINLGRSFYRTASGNFAPVPLITAPQDILYYQDEANPELFGVIELIEPQERDVFNVNNVIGQATYTSPNGVEFTNGLKVQFRGTVIPEEYQDGEYYVEGVGSAIQLLPIVDYVTPEPYTRSRSIPYDSAPFDVGNYDGSLNQPLDPDYVTINRASINLNAWSRSNRWFHADVIKATAAYNNTSPVLDNQFRAQRPIIEFRGGLKLFNGGVSLLSTIDVIDLTETDALSNVNLSASYETDGFQLLNGSRIVFASDTDPLVRKQVYQVAIQDVNGDGNDQIVLNPVTGPTASVDDTVVVASGIQNRGKTYRFDGNNWVIAQQKTSLNQPPLFDIFDQDEKSLSDPQRYPGSTFKGSPLFSYAQGTGSPDLVLGFPLQFRSIDNIGDIVFDNNFYTDTFTTIDNRVGVDVPVSIGFVREYKDADTYQILNGWRNTADALRQRQIFRFRYRGDDQVALDIPARLDLNVPGVQITSNSQPLLQNQFAIAVNGNQTVIEFLDPKPGIDSIIEVRMLSDQRSQFAYYEVPVNLEKNPFNQNQAQFTLGTARTHYASIVNNLRKFEGETLGANNIRDLGDVIPFGSKVLQHSSSLTLSGLLLKNNNLDFFAALEFNARAYEKYKAQILDAVARNDFGFDSPADILDQIVEQLALGFAETSPFYWTDMMPANNDYTETVYNYTAAGTDLFDTLNIYNYQSANYRSLLVYVNDQQLVKDIDYVVFDDAARIRILSELAEGDTIKIREYASTAGSFVPNTPTKLGLYPKFVPSKYVDDTFVEPAEVIQGHDGSVTVAYGDIRDDVLLEFELRIYNNIKIDSEIPLPSDEVVPGQFRTTGYSLLEVENILSASFVNWLGQNNIDFRNQQYDKDNAFTWNYSSSISILDRQLLPGFWRQVYEYYYDTDRPHTHPWEMLGFGQQPKWWEQTYGPAPYTSGNLVLWDDLENGTVREPGNIRVNDKKIRPGLTSVIPVDGQGNLLPPQEVLVSAFDTVSFRRQWTIEGGSPAKSAWRRSSSYPFSVQRLLALTKPGKYFALNVDRDRYQFDQTLGQYLFDGRYQLDSRNIELPAAGIAKHSYFNWVFDFGCEMGRTDVDEIARCLGDVDVRLAYRLAGFSDKRYLRIFSERATPNSQNSSLLIPEESYSVLLHRNVPMQQILFSSVIVQRTESGWAVLGNSTLQPYFEIAESIANGNFDTITVGGLTVNINKDYSGSTVQVPYGRVYSTPGAVVNFLVSYGKHLDTKGLRFDSEENDFAVGWTQLAQEFLNWSQQGWSPGAVIHLNPGAKQIKIQHDRSVVDNLLAEPGILLNQNRIPLTAENFVVDRYDDETVITVLSDDTIGLANIKLVSYEHALVLDNLSIFSDLIYEQSSGNRQSRITVSGIVTDDWNGQIEAPGFLITNGTVPDWEPNKKYFKGEIVRFKDTLWSARKSVEPSDQFDFSQWLQSDFDETRQGLLPNIASKAEFAKNFYNNKSANLNTDEDLLAFGITAFRPRQYMENLNFGDITQVNVYGSFLDKKGTKPTAELLSNANLAKESTEYRVYENWAIKQADYGAVGAKAFVELALDRDQLTANPSRVEIIDSIAETSTANQTVLLRNLFKQSRKFDNSQIFPTVSTNDLNPEKSIPNAGYVNTTDVDIRWFSFDSDQQISDSLDQIAVGKTIWVAKNSLHDWNIYRVELLSSSAQTVQDNLDGTSSVIFDSQHNLKTGDVFVLRFFDNSVDGVYRVLRTPKLDTVVVNLSLPGTQSRLQSTSNIAFRLAPIRVDQPSDIVGFAEKLTVGDRVWVDNNNDGKWAVIEKQEVFGDFEKFSTQEAVFDFGQTVSQGMQNSAALIGSKTTNGTGRLFTFVKDVNNQYLFNSLLDPQVDDCQGFGDSVSTGANNWAIVGAPQSFGNRGCAIAVFKFDNVSTSFDQLQVLTAPDAQLDDYFGHAVAVSKNENWVYVSAVGANKIYAYQRVDRQAQSVQIVADGQSEYQLQDIVRIATPEQLSIVVNGQLQVLGIDYGVDINTQSIEFDPGSIPEPGDDISVAKKQTINLVYRSVGDDTAERNIASLGITNANDLEVYVAQNPTPLVLGTDYTVVGDTLTFITVPTVGQSIYVINKNISQLTFDDYDSDTFANSEQFTVFKSGKILRPVVDYTIDTNGNIDFVGSYLFEDVSVRAGTYFKYVDTVSIAESGFGSSLTTTSDGRQLIVGSPQQNRVYAYDRAVERFVVNDAAATEFVTRRSLSRNTLVLLNNQALVQDNDQNINESYTVDVNTNTVSISQGLSLGDRIEIETASFELIQVFESGNNKHSDDALFGFSVDQCPTNCSVYVGAPNNSVQLFNSGSVDRYVNQARIYGSLSGSNTADTVTLTPGHTVRINNIDVEVSSVPVWSSSITYDAGDFVSRNGDIFQARTNAPAGADPDLEQNSSFWKQSSWIEVFVNDINQAKIENAEAMLSADCILIRAKNVDTAPRFSRLIVLPGIGTAFADLGLMPYTHTQTINHPRPEVNAQFGYAVSIDTESDNLVIGAPGATAINPVEWSDGVSFDLNSTKFVDTVARSGAVYVFDYLPSVNDSVLNPGQFVFGQQLYIDTIESDSRLGTSVNYSQGQLLTGAIKPGNIGEAYVFVNQGNQPSWKTIRQQPATVDSSLIDRVFLVDRRQNQVIQYLDWIDPLNGKILGAAQENIDYISAVDPAVYNVGDFANNSHVWREENIGKVWWDVADLRLIDYNQEDADYASLRWGKQFVGSQVNIYQWVESDVAPENYAGPGRVRDTENYSVRVELSADTNTFVNKYYFWVKDLDTVDLQSGKSLSPATVARYIESPLSSGIPYVAFVSPSQVALYNCQAILQDTDNTILHIEFSQQKTSTQVHVQYDLVPEGKADKFLNQRLYRKLLDSLTGFDTAGNTVPDVLLSPADFYGVSFRPRQSMFADRLGALQNYYSLVNSILKKQPIVETKSLRLLNSQEPLPSIASTGVDAWDMLLETVEELEYQNLNLVSTGYRYLIRSDANNQGLWTIYEVDENQNFQLVRVQAFNTPDYWNFVDWYQEGVGPLTRIKTSVPLRSDLESVIAVEGDVARVNQNSQGKWELYKFNGINWSRVALQDGTIEISNKTADYQASQIGFDAEVFDAQNFDLVPAEETRRIVRAINEELLIDELEVERNRCLILLFDYILSEQPAADWLQKTSLIDVDHVVRELLPFDIYRKDNQDFIFDYINEVKPYRTKIREFNLKYQGQEEYPGSVTDFDLPAVWDEQSRKFVSPVLDNTGTLSTTSSLPDTDPRWSQFPWSEWFNNYELTIDQIVITDRGQGYTIAPQVIFEGDCAEPARAIARINSLGQVFEIVLQDAGCGYLTTPTVRLVGGNGTGAAATVQLKSPLARAINVALKFDRHSYRSSIVEWQPNTAYSAGDLVSNNNELYIVVDSFMSGTVFESDNLRKATSADLPAIERILKYYQSTGTTPGLALPLLIDGLEYPGVQVSALGFDQSADLDTVYSSEFADSSIGLKPEDINVDGAQFIDIYSSHAPEELTPGSVFDTLDLKVYTRPGADNCKLGHGWPIAAKTVQLDTQRIVDLPDLYMPIAAVKVINLSAGRVLSSQNYNVDWNQRTVDLTAVGATGNIVRIEVFGVGGSNHLYYDSLPADSVINDQILIPVTASEIDQILLLTDGVENNSFDFEPKQFETQINFNFDLQQYENITVFVFGVDDPQFGYSYPQTQSFVFSGSREFLIDSTFSNPAHAIVEVDGRRLTPPNGVDYISDGSTTVYSTVGVDDDIDPDTISANEILVYVNDRPLKFSSDFSVPSAGTVQLAAAPSEGDRISVYVRTRSDYRVVGNQLIIRDAIPITTGSRVEITTWVDTREQRLLTRSYIGSVATELPLIIPFDNQPYDTDLFDQTGDLPALVSRYNLRVPYDYEQFDVERMWVTYNGNRLEPNKDFVVVQENNDFFLDIVRQAVSLDDIVVVTVFGQSVVPPAIAFGVFDDMQETQGVYRILEQNTTRLTQDLLPDDEFIHVENANALPAANLEKGIFGAVMVGSERITYRERDIVNNTLSGLRRGTSGTAAAPVHIANTSVTDISKQSFLPNSEPQFVVLSEGETEQISNNQGTTVEIVGSNEGYTKGKVWYRNDRRIPSGYFLNRSWYRQGEDTACDGTSLQTTNTRAARFLRGQD